MKRLIGALPGPPPVRYLLALLILAVALVVLFFIYDWVGTNLLDTGGAIG